MFGVWIGHYKTTYTCPEFGFEERDSKEEREDSEAESEKAEAAGQQHQCRQQRGILWREVLKKQIV